jgi:hypothetical protein
MDHKAEIRFDISILFKRLKPSYKIKHIEDAFLELRINPINRKKI